MILIDDFQDDVNALVSYYEQTHPAEIELNAELAVHIRHIYRSPFIRRVLLRQHELVLLDSAV